MASLTVIRRPDPGQFGPVQPAEDFTLTKDKTLIGRHPLESGVDVQLLELIINRHHATITRAEGAYWIEDLISRHGTRLNKAPVFQRARLRDGDEIQIGSYSLLFHDDAKPVPVKQVVQPSEGNNEESNGSGVEWH